MQKKFGYLPLARPLNFMPDIIMGKNGKIALVEAKASMQTSRSKILTTIRNTTIDLLGLIAKAQYHSSEYIGFVVGTEIENINKFTTYVLEMNMWG